MFCGTSIVRVWDALNIHDRRKGSRSRGSAARADPLGRETTIPGSPVRAPEQDFLFNHQGGLLVLHVREALLHHQ
jgi:hypothetical protein